MPSLSTYLAEEALSLPPAERTKLVEVLVDSLRGTPLPEADLAKLLKARSLALQSGADAGLSFDEIFGEAL
jgi:putative addiction module component (TIGR02574 family)